MSPPVRYCQERKTFVVSGYEAVAATVTVHAHATLRHNNMTGGSGASGQITPPGWLRGGCPSHHNRGHLVGDALGGSGGESKNLVTLTAGTNHPIMYDFEYLVNKYVTAKRDKEWKYVIWCRYSEYSSTPRFPIPGATGNPFCLFPAPSRLLLALRDDRDQAVSIADIILTADPHADRDRIINVQNASMSGSYLIVPNGVYKESHGPHDAEPCWQTSKSVDDEVLRAATEYAESLGYRAVRRAT